MICMYENHATKTLEEYKQSLKKKSLLFILFGILGLVSILVAVLLPADSFLTGFYLGVGIGLLVVSVIKLIMNLRIQKNEDLLKQKKRETSDERNISISVNAVRSTAFLLLFVCYIGMFIGSLYNMTVFWCLWGVIMFFLISYVLLVFYYRHKM